MSDRDAFQDGRQQGWRDKERECEKLKAEIDQLRAALKEIDLVAARHMKGAIGNAQRIARAALEAEA